MSMTSRKHTVESRSSYKRLGTKDSLLSKKSRCSESFSSVHGSKFGRSVSKFPKQNDPSLVESISVVNSRVIRTFINFPVKVSSKLPDLTQKEATDCIRELGSFLNIEDYEFNYASFWLLDVLSKLIKDMQLKNFSVYKQNICLTWFRFVLRCISVSGAPREEIFSLLRAMFLAAEDVIKAGNPIPQPEETKFDGRISPKLTLLGSGILPTSKSLTSFSSKQSRRTLSKKSSKVSSLKSSIMSHKSSKTRLNELSKSGSDLSSNDDKVNMNLQHFYAIVEMIYKVFADRFVFMQISQAYSSPTILTPENYPIEFREPKQLKPNIVASPPMSPKSKKASIPKSGKKEKGKKKDKRKSAPSGNETEADTELSKSTAKTGKKTKDKGKKKKSSTNNETGAESELSKSTAKPGKKSKDKGKKKKSFSNDESDLETEENTKDEKKSKKEKQSKDKDKTTKDKGGKGKKKSKPSLSNPDETTDSKKKEKKTEKGGKKGRKSKSSGEEGIVEGNMTDKSLKGGKAKNKKGKKSSSLKEIKEMGRSSLDDKLRLFDRAVSPEMEVELEKIRTKDKFILPLSEAVGKDYVENLIKALIPPETKPSEEAKVMEEKKGKVEGKKKSSSLKGKKSLKGDKNKQKSKKKK